MFEDEVDGTPRPCAHPIRWYHRLAAWAHDRMERFDFTDREAFHNNLPDWVCESYERVYFDYPCWKCTADREREYGATVKTDDDVRAKFPALPQMPFDYEDGDDRDRVDDPFVFDPDD